MVCSRTQDVATLLSLYAVTTQGVYIGVPPFRAAQRLWRESLFEVQTVDTSNEMGDIARRLRTGEDSPL